MITLPSYFGGKNGNGVAQNLINRIPPHKTFVTLFAGHCGLFRNIKRAKVALINDLDPQVYKIWRDYFKNDADVGTFNANAIAVLLRKSIGSLPLDMPGVFIYLDPPYMMDTRKSPKNKYNFELLDHDHETLIDAIFCYQHAKIMISHYECPAYDKLVARGWYKHSYPAMTRGGLVTETIYFNYPPPTELHDYRYIGADFREREALKRVKVNVIKKLDRLNPILRNSILTDLLSHFNAVDDHKI